MRARECFQAAAQRRARQCARHGGALTIQQQLKLALRRGARSAALRHVPHHRQLGPRRLAALLHGLLADGMPALGHEIGDLRCACVSARASATPCRRAEAGAARGRAPPDSPSRCRCPPPNHLHPDPPPAPAAPARAAVAPPLPPGDGRVASALPLPPHLDQPHFARRLLALQLLVGVPGLALRHRGAAITLSLPPTSLGLPAVQCK